MRSLARPVVRAVIYLAPAVMSLVGACSLETDVLGGSDGGAPDAADASGDADSALMDSGARDTSGSDSATVDSGAIDSTTGPDTNVPDTGADDTGAGASFCDGTDPALRACLRFEESVEDEAPARHAVTAAGHSFTTGRVGRGLAHGVGTQVWIEDASDLATIPYSFELWVRPDAIPTSGRIGILDLGDAYSIFMYPNGQVGCKTDLEALSGDGALAGGRWTHVACTVDAGRVRTYVDGALAGEGAHGSPGGSMKRLRIGGNSPSGQDFVGVIDEYRFFDDTRTDAEITAAARR